MNLLDTHILENWYQTNFESQIKGRRILFNDIEPLIKKLSNKFKKEILGYSENNIPIYKISIGTGSIKILSWSQMHGNESTGTKALFDIFNCFSNCTENEFKIILKECTLVFIPMLNPDGSQAYTRVNANNVDLNRDAVNRVAKESNLLRDTLEEFNPQFCFNLHDQRTIFSVEGTKNPATISFLAPSEELTRGLTKGRMETMNVIVSMNKMLQSVIPNFVGRYTDEFYPTATGDRVNVERINSTNIDIPLMFQFRTLRVNNFAAYALLGAQYTIDLQSQEDASQDFNDPFLKIRQHDYQGQVGVGLEFFAPFFKFGMEVKYSHGFVNTFVPEKTFIANPIDKMYNRSWWFSIIFEG